MTTIKGAAEGARPRWTDVFSRSSVSFYGYAIKPDWQGVIHDFVRRHGSALKYLYLGGMTSYAGEAWVATLLDGEFIHRKGVMWAEYGGGNGVWLSGRKAIRYVCYCFDVPQPRRWAGEETVPTHEELREETRAMREANEGSWRWR